ALDAPAFAGRDLQREIAEQHAAIAHRRDTGSLQQGKIGHQGTRDTTLERTAREYSPPLSGTTDRPPQPRRLSASFGATSRNSASTAASRAGTSASAPARAAFSSARQKSPRRSAPTLRL